MSDLEPEIVQPPPTDTGSGLGFENLDPLGITSQPPGVQPRSAQHAWTSMMGTVGRKVPNHLKWSLRYRNAMMTLARQRSRL